ncbi:hydrogenase expression/formation protein HypE [Desulfotalea psychrophila]|uniref:Hydrogenase expression/formation protein HypE n=1 Tax=Desulfotalea psychrophila TaxID=84980 RepID=A0ABS3ATW3_9BACT|nr:hydrogenase expression/formation protein HypE [Desulfocapsa sp.]MBN4065237.1 hydrogenase expression/formation protein HypE [Desulfocapsa sp. AH-315-G09]MBN4068052.1 hydrogenase expression/formation protein HypE [Desulfotalea psychrophila]MBN4071650.1 hydrogenase expression/formation protein HypE [Desulfotalea psychrophila]
MEKYIILDHGSGGLASQNLIGSLFLKYLKNSVLNQLEDAAVLPPEHGQIAFSTDSYVVDPVFFPGGNIGELAVNGTINDLAMRGARPICLSLGLILEEGFAVDELEKIIKSIANACDYAGVPVVTGDTKVVPRGKADKIFINTSGIGIVEENININASQAQPGDIILLSGTLADHGITILTSREGLQVDANLLSDTRPLHFLAQAIVKDFPGAIHTMRDPTRGGLGTTLSEIAKTTKLCMEIEENSIPMHAEVRAACELMGLDPLYLANEGKCMVLAAPEYAEEILHRMRSVPEGRDTAIIGRVSEKHAGRVVLTTVAGGRRLVEPLSGEPLPRIC